jgi:hypothetical protein
MNTQIEEPRCPFCFNRIEQPKELLTRKIVEFPLGVCDNCGAVYVYDATGHNMGAAFIEGLLFACNEDDYLAFSLSYGEDYTDAVIGNYDLISHSITPEKIHNERYIRGVLIFIKLFGEFQEVTGEFVKEKAKTLQPITKNKMRSDKFSKEKVREYALNNKKNELFLLAEEDSRVLNELQRLLYTPDELLRWRIIELLAQTSKIVSSKRPDLVSKFLSVLLQSAANPGSSAWGAIEAAGAIISANTLILGEFSPALLSFLQQKNLLREVTWAIGRIALIDPELAKYRYKTLLSLLNEDDPVVRGNTAWALGNIGFNDAVDELVKLKEDNSVISIWIDNELKETTVSSLVREAVNKIALCNQP